MRPDAIAQTYRELRWASRDAIFANNLLKGTPIVFEKANRFGFQILQEYLSFYERYSNQHGGGLFRLENPGHSFQTTELSADIPRGLFATPSLSYDAKPLYFAFADFSRVQSSDPNKPILNAYHLRNEGDASERVRQFLTESDGKYCLYSMDLATGRCQKLTSGPWDDFDPTLLPDGTGAVTLFGNYTENPVACIQPRPIPNSNKIVFIATAHHTAVGGSIVILDPTKVKYAPETGQDSLDSIERITPEIPFPETPNPETGEMYLPNQYYYGPTPLSEDFFLVSYSFEPSNGYLTTNGELTEDTVGSGKLGLYYRDRFGNLELLFEDEQYSCRYPLILRQRETIPEIIPTQPADESLSDVDKIAENNQTQTEETGTFTLFNVQESLCSFPSDRKIKTLRVYQLLPKSPSHTADVPKIGHDFAGNARLYLGSVPIEEDGSAYFTAPARKPLYFQVVDETGRAVQTMLSEVYLQPGENRGCVGCHEQQQTTFSNSSHRVSAALRAPSVLEPGPQGSNPFSYPILIQPLLDKKCVSCHSGKEGSPVPTLTGEPTESFSISYDQLSPYLRWYAWFGSIREIVSLPGECGADASSLSTIIEDENHQDIGLTYEDKRFIYFWLDSNIPFYGDYSPEAQKRQQEVETITASSLQ